MTRHLATQEIALFLAGGVVSALSVLDGTAFRKNWKLRTLVKECKIRFFLPRVLVVGRGLRRWGFSLALWRPIEG